MGRKKAKIHTKLSLKEIGKRHKSNVIDKELHKVIESDEDNGLIEKFNNLLKKAFKPAKP